MQKKVFAKGFCLTKIMIFFVLGSVIGALWEDFMWLIKYHELMNRHLLLYGPFQPAYGLLISIFIIIFAKNNMKRKIWITWLFCALLGGFIEFITSFISEYIFHTILWDYSNELLNINGRTTILFMIFYGIGGTLLLKVIYPLISKKIEIIPYKIGNAIYYLSVIFIVIDIVITSLSIFRMVLHDYNISPLTPVGEWLDENYSQEVIFKKIPALIK